MIVGDKKAQPFFDNVVTVVHRTRKPLHYPDEECLKNKCYCREETNWKALRFLSDSFWKHGPDVNALWKQTALRAKFNPSDLHELMLGVFVSGAGGHSRGRITDTYPGEFTGW